MKYSQRYFTDSDSILYSWYCDIYDDPTGNFKLATEFSHEQFQEEKILYQS